MIPHIMSDTSLTLLGSDFVPKTIPHTHPAWDDIVAALDTGDLATVERLSDLPSAIVSFMQGAVTISDRVLYFNGQPIDTALTRRILSFMEAERGELAQPLINFLQKVMRNPSRRAVQGLYEWVDRSKLPITPEGDILAWKIVGPEYFDLRTRTFDNSVGKIVEISRNEVDEDPNVTCSHGLHFCSTGYLPHYGAGDDNRVMVVKIDPADVVAFPRDYDTSKGRCCRYEVIGEIDREKAKTFFPTSYVYDPDGVDFMSEEIVIGPDDVGSVYLTRDGREATVTAFDRDNEYPVEGELDGEAHSWDSNGFWYEVGNEYGNDLVELIRRPEPKPARGWFSRLFR